MTCIPQKLWTISDWKKAYRTGQIQLADLYEYVKSINNDDHAWISIATPQQLESQINQLSSCEHASNLPLYGVPFAVKDNIDVENFITTAACKEASYLAQADATVVAKLKAAGAIVIGKTNLDQFATGLVGVRSPYGAVKNSFNPEYISGGSSSGSSVVVAHGIVPFSLGTDTAGSGRVPAGHNNIVGLKPTKGWFSTHGVIPACRTLDTVSIFALTVQDAWSVASLMQGYDSKDAYSRQHPANVPAQFCKKKIAIPDQLEFYGDIQSERAFETAVQRLKALDYEVESINFEVFNQLAAALYQRSWVAERAVALDARVERQVTHPVIHQIIDQADQFTAVDVMQDEYDRAEWSRYIQLSLEPFDALMVPTAPTIYRITDVAADPLTKNSHMGAYTNFVNFADLSALALPNVIRDDGLPSGITLISHAWKDQALANFGQIWQQHTQLALGKSDQTPPEIEKLHSAQYVKLAVVGAHLTGMPLNTQLTLRNATLIEKTKTAEHYQLYALKNSSPAKPGLQYVNQGGVSIDVEVWDVPTANFGEIVAEVPAPLGIGNVQLADGRWVKGFICEGYALNDAVCISHFGGWKPYIHAVQHSDDKFNAQSLGEVLP